MGRNFHLIGNCPIDIDDDDDADSDDNDDSNDIDDIVSNDSNFDIISLIMIKCNNVPGYFIDFYNR